MTPAELAQTFAGRYVMPLVWREGTPSDSNSAVVLEDEIVIELVYGGADGTAHECARRLEVEIVARITTRDTGLDASGIARLTAETGAVDRALLSFVATGRAVVANLTQHESGPRMSGTLSAQSSGLPSSWAEFSSPDAGVGGAGGSP